MTATRRENWHNILRCLALQSTARRSTLRIQRESELLGSVLQSYHSRENVVIGAKFFQDDLPYFVELLAEVASMTEYKRASRYATWPYTY